VSSESFGIPTTTSISDPNEPRSWIRPYYSSFNGIRGLAVLMVFFEHNAWLSPWHHLAMLDRFLFVWVDLFFVLSGFLITGILYDSLQDPHYFKNFYIRRALRIFPVFYGFFLIVLILTPILHLDYGVTTVGTIFYVENLLQPFTDLAREHAALISMPFHGHLVPVASIGHFWSLCVEEQFYLIWPAVVWIVRDRQRLMRVCIIGSILALLGRIAIQIFASPATLEREILYISTYTRFDTLLIGSWLALYLRGRLLSLVQLRRMSSLLFWPSTILALVGGFYKWRTYLFQISPFTRTIGFTLIALAATGFIMRSLDESSALSRVLRNRFLNALGVVSYGFYLYHGIPGISVHYFAEHNRQLSKWVLGTIPIIVFVITFGIAQFSFRYFETPFLRLKKTLAPQKTAEARDQ